MHKILNISYDPLRTTVTIRGFSDKEVVAIIKADCFPDPVNTVLATENMIGAAIKHIKKKPGYFFAQTSEEQQADLRRIINAQDTKLSELGAIYRHEAVDLAFNKLTLELSG